MKKTRTGRPAQVPDLQALHLALERAEESFRLLFEASPEALIRVEGGHLRDCNPAACALFGISDTGVLRALQAEDLSPLHQPDGRLSSELLQEHMASAGLQRRHVFDWVGRRLDTGREFACKIAMLATGPEADAALLLALHVPDNGGDAEKQAEMAYYDPLTHLPNRRLFYDRLINVLAHSRRYGRHATVIAIELDVSVPGSDTAAQQENPSIADLLRCAAAQRICTVLRSADTIARLDGDLFVVLLGDMAQDRSTAEADALRVAEKICRCFDTPCPLTLRQPDGRRLDIVHDLRAGIGLALFSAQMVLAEDLLQQAIDASQRARSDGGRQPRLNTSP